jgi:EpsI family protein
LRGLGLVRGGVLLVLSFGIIVVSNAARVITSGLSQEYVGRWAIEGWCHEVLGIAAVLVGLALIVAASGLFVRGKREGESAPPAPPQPARRARGGATALALLTVAAVGCGWAEQFRQAHREEVQLERLPYAIAGWAGEDTPIDPVVREMLKCDQVIQRTFTDPLGRQVVVYLMFWATPASTAHIHHPDVCWPNRGWQPKEEGVRPVPMEGGRPPLPVSSRLYTRGQDRQLVYYWTQRGREVLPDGKEPQQAFFADYGWVADLLRGRAPMARQARLSVLLGADVVGPADQLERKLQAFTSALAGEVYGLCPWAVPDGESGRKKDDSAGAAGL